MFGLLTAFFYFKLKQVNGNNYINDSMTDFGEGRFLKGLSYKFMSLIWWLLLINAVMTMTSIFSLGKN